MDHLQAQVSNCEQHRHLPFLQHEKTICARVFSSMLTAENVTDIERIQKIVLKVIMSDQYQSYDQACQLLGTIPLENGRKLLSLKFALACLKSPQYRHHFKQRLSPYYKLRKIKSFEEPFCHSQRYYL